MNPSFLFGKMGILVTPTAHGDKMNVKMTGTGPFTQYMVNKCYACSVTQLCRFFEIPGGFPLYDQGFCGSSAGKESTCNAEDLSSIPGSGRSTGEGIGYPLQYSGLENSMDCVVHGVVKSQT